MRSSGVENDELDGSDAEESSPGGVFTTGLGAENENILEAKFGRFFARLLNAKPIDFDTEPV